MVGCLTFTRYGLKFVVVAVEKWLEIHVVKASEVKRRMIAMLVPRLSSTTFVLKLRLADETCYK